MSLRLGALHDALLHPGDPDLAQRAAEEVANYERQMADLRSDLRVLTWMVGTNVAISLALLWLVVTIFSRLPS